MKRYFENIGEKLNMFWVLDDDLLGELLIYYLDITI
jgi:hypothetical protein